jgi:hypothetical protein
MLVVGPAKCQVSTIESRTHPSGIPTIPCGLIVSHGMPAELDHYPGLEECLFHCQFALAAEPAAIRYALPSVSLAEEDIYVLGVEDLRQTAFFQDPPSSAGFSIGTGVLVAEYEVSRDQRTTPAAESLRIEESPRDRTGYDRAYDEAMGLDDSTGALDARMDGRFDWATLDGVASQSTLVGATLTSSRIVKVLRRTVNGELWHSSSEAIRRERLAAAARRARLDRIGSRSLNQRLAFGAAAQLDELGGAIFAAASRLRAYASRGESTTWVSSVDRTDEY